MRYEALIIGGGMAGSTLATLLALHGREVLLLEKTTASHDKMCGDFLSEEALHYLASSGIDPMSLGAVPIDAVRLARREIDAEAPLPFRALSLRRRILDEALLQGAVTAGVSLRRGVSVQSISRQATQHSARLDSENTIAAPSLFIATGKHDLQGQPRRVGWQNDMVAFKMYFRLSPSQEKAIHRHIELIFFPGGYAGLQLVDAGLANLCLLVTRCQLHRCGANWAKLFQYVNEQSPHLGLRLSGATPMLNRPLALSSIPYGFLTSSTVTGLWPLGDQSAVIPSFSGDGMSIALHSAHLAAQMYLDGDSSTAFAARMRRDLRFGLNVSTVISQLLVHLPVAAALARWGPSLLQHIASATRIPARALIR